MKKRILLNLFQGFFYFLLSLGSLHGQVQLTQLGFNIYGETAGGQSGRSVSSSADGLTIALGAPFNNQKGSNFGHARA